MKTLLFCALLFPVFSTAVAQDTLVLKDSTKKKTQRFYFGFSLTSLTHVLQSSELDIDHFESNDGLPDTVSNMQVRGMGGVQLGLVLEFRLSKNIFLSFNPSASVRSRLKYTFTDPEANKIRYKNIPLLELPASVAYKFQLKHCRPFVAAGMAYKSIRQNSAHPANFYSAGLALGLETKLGKCIFAPEIRFWQALKTVDLLRFFPSELTPVDRFRLNGFCVSLVFKA